MEQTEPIAGINVLTTAPRANRFWNLTPVIGTIIFVVLYIVATLLYPGGSQVDKNAAGFSWLNNYWCNLLNEKAINGTQNPARPVALTAMVTLCFTISFFWYLIPTQMNLARHIRRTIQFAGLTSMITAMFLFTSLHDTVINIAGFFGIVAFLGTIAGLYKAKLFFLLRLGIFNIFLVALNNYVYYTKGLIIYLPVIQKISFASFLLWICCINIILHYKTKPVVIT